MASTEREDVPASTSALVPFPEDTAGHHEALSARPLPTPAFLANLRPPPLPLWAVPHATNALTASRVSLFVAHSTSDIGFKIARTSTQFGFKVARALFAPLVSAAGAILDHSLGLDGGDVSKGPLSQSGKVIFDGAETLALFGIEIGNQVTRATLNVTSSTVASLEAIYGNDEALRALSAFLTLVKKERTTSLPTDPYPEGGMSHFSAIEIGKAAATWAALQSVTGQVEGARIAPHLKVLDLSSWGRSTVEAMNAKKSEDENRGDVVWEITEEEILEGGEEVIEATVSDVGSQSERSFSPIREGAMPKSEEEITRHHLRRFSKLCLGSYGGIGVVFFGVKLPSVDNVPSPTSATSTPLTPAALSALTRRQDEDSLAQAFGSVSQSSQGEQAAVPNENLDKESLIESEIGELDAGWIQPAAQSGSATPLPGMENKTASSEKPPTLDLWGLLTGSHDVHVVSSLGEVDPLSTKLDSHLAAEETSDEEDLEIGDLRTMTTQASKIDSAKMMASRRSKIHSQVPKGRRPPRFFIITDHPNKSILLCLRGTLTIDDVATDLACEPSDFNETLFWDEVGSSSPEQPLSSSIAKKDGSKKAMEATDEEEIRINPKGYTVHGGMFEVALAMGGPDGPVTRAIARALRKNVEYDLFLIGHSLGAGIASLLGIMWANPESCLTSSKSGLPVGRKVKVYGFAPPCTTDAELAWRCKKLIHSFVYSSDAVSRFSLGHVKDIRSAATWLCYANKDRAEESCNNILSRIIAYKRGKLDNDLETKLDEEAWFASLRTTLEANMHYSTLFPPGTILWLTRPDDVELPNDITGAQSSDHRLFEITGRADVVFKQMMFTQKMLSSHLPHQYMSSIHDFL